MAPRMLTQLEKSKASVQRVWTLETDNASVAIRVVGEEIIYHLADLKMATSPL